MMERLRAISDDELLAERTQGSLQAIADWLNPALAAMRGEAMLRLHERGWTYDRLALRYGIKKSAVQQIISAARRRRERPVADDAR